MGNRADERYPDITIGTMSFKEARGVTSPCEEERRFDDEEHGIVVDDKERQAYCELAASDS